MKWKMAGDWRQSAVPVDYAVPSIGIIEGVGADDRIQFFNGGRRCPPSVILRAGSDCLAGSRTLHAETEIVTLMAEQPSILELLETGFLEPV